ncbi:MAG: P-II family nitrogen regulator [Clostridia bacterium]|nr:P-II family nitrogen regulator [Clostridia bacterium]
MELYLVMSIVDRKKADKMAEIFEALKFSVVLENLGVGTATSEHLLLYDLDPSEKAVFTTIATRKSVQELFLFAEEKMYIDIPGNGIMLSIPLKSVSGGSNLAYITEGQEIGGGKPHMEFKHELIVVIIKEGHSDEVMEFARKAGAGGGTVLHAKGTGTDEVTKFMGVSIAPNKDMIYILSDADKKADIMKAISENCGKGKPAEAFCFSLPVSAVAGLREISKDFFKDGE